MKPIPQEFIDAMPDKVEDNRESCEAAADAVLEVLFLMGAQLEHKPEWPPIISNGAELWHLPAPWAVGEMQRLSLLANLNGTDEKVGYLESCRRNAAEFNEALEGAQPDVAIAIAGMGPADSAHVWEYLNALACSVEDEGNYKTLVLSGETRQAFYFAVGLKQ